MSELITRPPSCSSFLHSVTSILSSAVFFLHDDRQMLNSRDGMQPGRLVRDVTARKGRLSLEGLTAQTFDLEDRTSHKTPIQNTKKTIHNTQHVSD